MCNNKLSVSNFSQHLCVLGALNLIIPSSSAGKEAMMIHGFDLSAWLPIQKAEQDLGDLQLSPSHVLSITPYTKRDAAKGDAVLLAGSGR